MDPGMAIFGHFIDFGHFPIEIPIEAEKFYGKWKEGSYIKNKNSFEISEQNGTACRYFQVKKNKNHPIVHGLISDWTRLISKES